MRWPWQRAVEAQGETRGVYTDAIVTAIIAARGTNDQTLEQFETGAVEAVAGIYARAFAQAEVSGAELATADLAHMGRELVTRGESVWLRAEGQFRAAATKTVRGGGVLRDTWTYQLQVPSPDGLREYERMGSQVVHLRWSFDASRPWVGVSAFDRAGLALRGLAGAEARIGEEISSPVGSLLPVPKDAGDASLTDLKGDLATLRGRTALVETTAGGWGDRGAAPSQDWVPRRVGGDPPPSVISAREGLQAALLGACGVPPELILGSTEGTAQREAWRRFLHGSVQPLGRQASDEFSRLVGSTVEFDFERLFASDVQGRARAFQSMVAGGMEPGAAAAASGLLEDDEEGAFNVERQTGIRPGNAGAGARVRDGA